MWKQTGHSGTPNLANNQNSPLLGNNCTVTQKMEKFKPFNLGIEPSPSTPMEILMQDGWTAFLLFEPFASNGVVVVECERCSSTRFGYPNDEGLEEHPYYHDGISEAESSVLVSSDTPWLSDVVSQQHASSHRIWGKRGMAVPEKRVESFHFIILLKEATFECIAKTLRVAFTAKSMDEAFTYVRQRFAEH